VKKILMLLSILLCANYAHAQYAQSVGAFGQIDNCILIEEEDGSPANWACLPLKVSNGSLTDNGDGTFSLSFSGGSGGSCWESNGASGIMPVSGSCTDAIWEDNGSGGIMPKL